MKKLVLAVALVTMSGTIASKVYAAQTGVKMELRDDDKKKRKRKKEVVHQRNKRNVVLGQPKNLGAPISTKKTNFNKKGASAPFLLLKNLIELLIVFFKNYLPFQLKCWR